MIQATLINGDGSTEVLVYNTDKMLLSEIVNEDIHSLETPCGGAGVCGKCLVLAQGDLSALSQKERELGLVNSGQRLACVTYALGQVVIKRVTEDGRGDEKIFTPEGGGPGLNQKTTRPLSQRPRNVHVAIDVGTTGLTAELVDDQTSRVLASVSMLNPQVKYGHDVLTRIGHARDKAKGTHELSLTIEKGIQQLIFDLILKAGSSSDTDVFLLDKVYVAGNTTMQHLIHGVNPETIARAPYRPVFLNVKKQTISLGLDFQDQATITLLPSASAYIGADITSGIFALDFHKPMEDDGDFTENKLFIDIGTNGEIVMKSARGLHATSTAAGPALEGMNIACGMRAQTGAIDRFSIDTNGEFQFTTLGNTQPKGICGSGLIDIMAEFVDKKIVLKNGRFNKDMDPTYACQLKDKKFYITEAIYLSQKDIRQVQLAKSAIATGIDLLYRQSQMEMADCSEIIVAGSFGYYLSETNIKKIGLIPNALKAPVNFVGNASLDGVRKALTSERGIESIGEISKQIQVVELSRRSDFQDVFVKRLGF